jgi:hypothetical protein
MRRRRFLLGSAALLAAASLPGCDGARRARALGIPIRVLRPGMAEGHALRAGSALPAAQGETRAEIAILGGGVAGLSAAWRLARAGRRDFVLLDGPEPDGNAAAARFQTPEGPLAAPRGAHYLPLPSRQSSHVREMLADLGIIEADPLGERPRYDEMALAHAPQERVWLNGAWHEDQPPHTGLPQAARTELGRFMAYVDSLRAARGDDGRKVFAIPVVLSSNDRRWRALDGLRFAAWLDANGYRHPDLLAYLDYACRDDYGAGLGRVSAWAGLHYFAARAGQAANAEAGAVLTWPEGLGRITAALRARLPPGTARPGYALRVEERAGEARALCLDGAGRAYTLRARRVICAMPLHVAARVVAPIADLGFDPGRHLPEHAAWLVGNVLLRGFPKEAPGAPLAWDNVIQGSRALGWVVSTHQDLRAARPGHVIFTTYRALDAATPGAGRAWLAGADDAALLDAALADLEQVYNPLDLWRRIQAIELTLRGHAMAVPTPGFLANPGRDALRDADGRILFAHADLSGYSVFEEAAWWGDQAARKALRG